MLNIFKNNGAMTGIDIGTRKMVSVRFSMEAHFDCLVELNDDSIEKLRAEIGRVVYQNEAIHKMLSAKTGPGTYDFTFRDEDIEVLEAEILPDYPYHSGKELSIECGGVVLKDVKDK